MHYVRRIHQPLDVNTNQVPSQIQNVPMRMKCWYECSAIYRIRKWGKFSPRWHRVFQERWVGFESTRL